MTAHRHVATTCLALLLGLAACAPAGPVALAPATAAPPPAAPLAPAPAATLMPPPVPSATPIVRQDSVAQAQAAGRLTPAEAAQLAALLAARAADWRIDPADTALRVERTPAGAICLLLTDADGAAIRLIYLTSLEPLIAAQTDLAAARAAAAAAGADPAAITGLGLDILTGQPGAFGAAGELLGTFDPTTGLWQFTPPPTPEPAATPTPEKRVNEENGVYTARTEKGEVVTAPAVPGTKQGIEAVSGIDRVVYRAEAGNPYGLEAGTLAGYFYPDTYTQTLEAKEATATGSLALHPNVVKVLLEQADYKNKGIFPLPFALQADTDQPLKIADVRSKTTGINYLILSVPNGATLVNPIPATVNGEIAPQPGNPINNTQINLESGHVYDSGKRLVILLADQKQLQALRRDYDFTTRITDIRHIFTRVALSKLADIFGQSLTIGANCIIYMDTNVGDSVVYPTDMTNLLRNGQVPIAFLIP